MTSFIKVDDILAALILSLVMMRRLEVKTALLEHNPGVPRESFERWRTLALRAYDQVAVASALKVVASIGWFLLASRLGIGFPWFHAGGLLVFLGWLMTLIWAWKIATDASHLRRQLGIQVRRRTSPTPP